MSDKIKVVGLTLRQLKDKYLTEKTLDTVALLDHLIEMEDRLNDVEFDLYDSESTIVSMK